MQPTDRNGFQIAILCALVVELDAVEAIFDEFWEENDKVQYGKAQGDVNSYTLGRIGFHPVVLAYIPGTGKVHSTAVTANLRASFPNIRLGLLVGVCGGLPQPAQSKQISLGDIIVSTDIVQFDFGNQVERRVIRKDTINDSLGRSNLEIRAFLHQIQRRKTYTKIRQRTLEAITEICGRDGFNSWSRPSPSQLEVDNPLKAQAPQIHYGLIASGDLVMKSKSHRDQIAAEENVLGFEMEGAGVWDTFPTLIVKAVCDYADSCKDNMWQPYASVAAAACAKALLYEWRAAVPVPLPSTTPSEQPASRTMHVFAAEGQHVVFNNYGNIENLAVSMTFHGPGGFGFRNNY